ncbi:methyltransferase domain-containing protein [Oscillatoria salina]|uniref:methyltransferase domain-containing protein n=1 Tax=Oscillatoria salina TaxID=331517 RepID=UPI0013B88839|nr:methyltransferase domain-containing protein [Oscillatoria salina]MBZ8182119.1 methyltransferase domain-containing protein [Oscillatoria salina IIICB1]NET87773.1 methyltransferase domain-containing protein [Kamptonema sp. SIO1D9]
MTENVTNQKQLYNVEASVLERYQAGAKEVQPSLCCPTDYDKNYLEIIPEEIIQKDYGCGDPTLYVSQGETVVDLGSGAGKNCYILAQKVGAEGKVIGVDFNDEMLNLARKYQSEIASQLGYYNTKFFKGKIQDLQLDLDLAEAWLQQNPINSMEGLSNFEAQCDLLRQEARLIPDNSVDVVISNCVLNLVRNADKKQLFQEIFRVLQRGGRAVISDIVCDEDPTQKILNDPDLWSGCIAGAFREDNFMKMFEDAGFYGIEILKRQEEPWQVIDGIEFRSVTVRAYKGKEGVCLERNQTVIYKGPWKQVQDDDGHILRRGERMAVCDKTYHIYTNPNSPYTQDVIPVPPYEEIPLDSAEEFNCKRTAIRHPQETKGRDYNLTVVNSNEGDCSSSSCC